MAGYEWVGVFFYLTFNLKKKLQPMGKNLKIKKSIGGCSFNRCARRDSNPHVARH